MVQRIHNLIELGKKHPATLEATGFDLKRFEETEHFLLDFKTVYAKKNDNKEADRHKEIKKARDHAALQLKEIVDVIRQHGQFVFWRHPEKKRVYISEHIRKKNKKNYKAKKAKTAGNPAGEETA